MASTSLFLRLGDLEVDLLVFVVFVGILVTVSFSIISVVTAIVESSDIVVTSSFMLVVLSSGDCVYGVVVDYFIK